MSTNNAKVQAVIETAILSAIDKVAKNESAGFISDLFLQADQESGELQIYDDNEKLLDKVIIFDCWVPSTPVYVLCIRDRWQVVCTWNFRGGCAWRWKAISVLPAECWSTRQEAVLH